jgi:undecaprenyl-diphosphatase
VFAGSLLRVLVGSPNRRPHGPEVVEGLARAGIHLRSLQALPPRGRRVTTYRAEALDGSRLRVELASPEDHGARVWVRLWRWIRLTDPGLEHPLTSLQRLIEHEALLSTLATNRGVRTPRLVAVGSVGEGAQVLAFDDVESVPLAMVPVELISDDVLRAAWGQVQALATARVAHRDLGLGHLGLDAAGAVWVTDFSAADPAPDDRLLAGDVAQLLCAAALAVGAERSARTAVEVLGRDAVAAALPRLQPLALAGSTRRSYRARRDLLGELRAAVQDATGVREVEFEDLARLKGRSVLGLVMVALAVYVLLPQLGDLGDITDEVARADPIWFGLAVAASAVTYLGAAWGIIGSVPDRVRLLPTISAQVASSFVNKVTPANVGGIALNARFLQKHGVETSVAFTAVGLSTVAGLVVHVSFLVTVAVWVGRSGDAQFSFPFGRTAVLVALAVLAAAALGLLVPAGRRLAMQRLVPPLRRSGSALREIAVRPTKIAALLGGSALVTIGYLVALACCLQAFGGGPPLASVALVFLAGTALATAAPTPGGLGAVEAALVAGLTGIGVRTEVAVSAVLSYRMLTFWLPVVPGWIAFVVLQRRLEL